MEVNMRFYEPDKNGKPVFASSGTNPKSKDRVSVVMLPRYIASRCATVDEAVALAKKLDIYSIQAPGMNWSLCFMMADATGNYGLLEIAQNKVSFLKKQPAQANFYVTKSFNKQQHYKAGLGRYATIMNGVKAKQENGAAKLRSMTRDQIMDAGIYWESTFTNLVNCNKRTLTVRFFEDENKVLTLGFDK